MVPKAGKQFRLLPGSEGASRASHDVSLAQLLIDAWMLTGNPPALATVRTSCLCVHLARHMEWAPQMKDLLHLACLGRQDLDDNRDAWSISANSVLRIVVRECESRSEILEHVGLCLRAEKIVDALGLFKGVEALMNQKLPDEFLNAVWDLRFDELSWLRWQQRPHTESALLAGRLGHTVIPENERASIPLPRITHRSAERGAA